MTDPTSEPSRATTGLARRRFLVTRPRGQSERLAALLRDAGAEALLAPMITIADATDPAVLDATLARLAEFDLAVFVSPTALDEVGRHLHGWPAELPAAVIGPASRDRALELGIADVMLPEGRYDSEGLLAHPALAQMAGKRVVVFRGNGGRELLAEALTGRGAIVEIVEAYRRLPPVMTREEVAALVGDGCDGVIVTSSEAAQNLFALADDRMKETLRAQLFFASHPNIADAVRRQGVTRVVGTATGDAGIVATLAECFAGPTAVAESPRPASSARAERRAHWVPPHVRWALGIGVISIATTLTLFRFSTQDIHGEMGQQMAAIETDLHGLYARAEQMDAHVAQFDGKLAQAEQRIDELNSQQADLRMMYSAVAGDQQEAMLADAELTLSLAAQQLQLTGSVGSALAALYRLDERVSGYGQPRLVPLRRALARDIDALKRVPWIDYVGLSAKIDALAGSVDKLPLAVDFKVPADTTPAAPTPAGGVLNEFGRAIGALVSIRRIDSPEPVLLAPEQALYLREHVKLRLLNARLAMLQRDEATFRLDLADAETELKRHFDIHAKPVVAALATLRDVAAAHPGLQLPNLSDSITAARDARRAAQKESKS